MLLLTQITVLITIFAGIIALLLQHWHRLAKFFSFALLGLSSCLTIFIGSKTLITQQTLTWQMVTAFPGLNWQFTLDPLAAFFLAIVGLIVLAITFYGPAYLRGYEKKRSITNMLLCTALFVAAMYLVLLASNVFSFLFAWELMSLSSYFLVIYLHENSVNRKAAFVYLLMAHASGLFILASFGILAKFSTNLDFISIHLAHLPTLWAHCAFILALIGFGMKAGIIPLHVWLPRAHPVAPSHISALMSGVMLKIAIYGLLRFVFSLLGTLYWQWGVTILIIGTVSALLGVLYALMQHDLKKLLAYHSIENIGIIFIGIGLAIIFMSTNHPVLAALGLVAALYHCLNHALFKSLLFLGAGVIQHQIHEQDLEKMGGLIHKMPHTALFFLIGCISISALPPFNGFVSEWLTYQTTLQAPMLSSGILRTLLPISAALLALTSALAATCFVKAYGAIFLGRPKTRQVRHAKDPTFSMVAAMGFLSLMCLVFGIFPVFTINLINSIPQQLLGTGLITTKNWLWLMPLTGNTTTYAPLLLCFGVLTIGGVVFWLVSCRPSNYAKKIKDAGYIPWGCGFGKIGATTQYTASAFAMPIRRVFKGVWAVTETLTKDNGNFEYNLITEDWSWRYFYEKLEKYLTFIARKIAYIQSGNVRIYLAYMFFTLLLLLWLVI